MSFNLYDSIEKRWVSVASLKATDISLNDPLLESKTVSEGFNEISTKLETLRQNMIFIYKNGTIGGGGGGGGATASGKIISETFLNSSKIFAATTENIRIHYKVTSRYTTNFQLSLKCGSKTLNTSVKPNMDYYWDVGKLPTGEYPVFISGLDADALPLDYFSATIVTGALEIVSDFNDDENIFNVASNISIPYTVNSYLNNKITIEYTINGSEKTVIEDVPKGIPQRLNLGKLPVGNYNVVLKAISQGESTSDLLTSNIIYWDIKVAGSRDVFVVIPSNVAKKYNIGIPINLPYSIITTAYSTFILTYVMKDKNNTVVKTNTYNNITVGSNYLVISTDDFSAGNYTIELSCKVQDDQSVISKNNPTVSIEMISDADFTPWQVNKVDLIAHFSARGQQSETKYNWENKMPVQQGELPITCTMFGINGKSTGFIEGKNALCIGGESYACIDYQPFREDRFALNGTTISIIAKIYNNGNPNSRIIDCAQYDMLNNIVEGININQHEINIKTSNISTAAKISEDEFIDITMVIGGPMDKQFLSIYVDGKLTSCKPVDSKDSLRFDGKIYLGCKRISGVDGNNQEIDILTEHADCEIKEIKIYKRALTSDEIVYNWLCDDYYMHTIFVKDEEGNLIEQLDKTRQLELRALNSINENGKFQVDTTNTSPFPIVEIDFGADQTTREEFVKWINTIVWNDLKDEEKFKKFACSIKYNDYKNKISVNKTGDGTFIRLQGTSSTGYTSKNFDIGFGTEPTTGKEFLMIPNNDWLPENIYTLKCNMMDSSHANNIGTGNLLSEYFMEKYPPMNDSGNNVNYQKVRYAIDGFPVILLCDLGGGGDVEGEGKSMSYMGIYTFNLGRTSYYNLGLKNYTFEMQENNRNVVKTYTDKFTGLYSPDVCFAYEVSTSSNDGAGAFKQISEEWIQQDWKKRFPPEASTEGDKQLRTVIKQTGASAGITEYLKDLGGNYILDGNGQKIVAYEPGTQWNDTYVWNKSSLVDYLIMAYVLGMTDNLGKNLVIKTWDKNGDGNSIWYATFYDMDTIMSLDNVGTLTYGPDVDLDAYPNGSFDDANTAEGRGKGQYNLSDSRLWDMLRTYNFESSDNSTPITASYVKTRYAYWRNKGIISSENIFKKFTDVINKIGATYYNKDAEIKYLNKFENSDGIVGYHNLTFLNGTREIYTKVWLRKRIVYLDSVFDYGNILIPDSSLAKPVKFRFNVSGSPSKTRTINMQSRSPVFVRVLWAGEDVPTDYSKLLVNSNKFTKFQKGFNANFQSTDFTFAPEITYMMDLNDGAPSVLRLEYSTNLMELDLSGNKLLKLLTVSGCTALRRLNLRNCTSLGTALTGDEASVEGTTQSNIDLSNCKSLQSVDISSTALSQLKLPDGGTLKNLFCNNSGLQKITLLNQAFLEEVDFTNCTSLTQIILENCENLKKINLTNASLTSFSAVNCPNLTEVILDSNIRLKNVNFSSTPNVKKLSLVDCNNTSLGFYSGNESTDLQNALNLIGCPNLEELNLTRCSAQVIYFNGDLTNTLKILNCYQSSWKQTILGAKSDGSTVTTFGKFNGKPAIDLKQFNSLLPNQTTFNSSTSVINIINLKYTSNSQSSMFNGCTNLERITGELTLNGSMSTFFSNSPKIVLNDYTNKNPENLSQKFDLTLILNVTSASSTFSNASSIAMNDVKYFLKRATALTSLNNTFFNCIGIVTDNVNKFPSNLFNRNINLTSLSETFWFCRNITGPYPVDLLKDVPKITTLFRCFAGPKFTSLESASGQSLGFMFRYNTLLTNLCDTFTNNDITTTVPLNASELFKYNTKLTNLTSCFSGNKNMEINLGILGLGQRHDDIFANNPELTHIGNCFNGVKIIGTIHENLFGGVESTRVQDGITYRYPTKLRDISGCFNNTGISGVFPEKLFYNLRNLENANNTFSNNSDISGTIPNDLFINNNKLISLNGFFANTKVNGNIPEGLFRSLTVCTSFADCFYGCNELTGQIPETLFSKCYKLNNINQLFYNCYRLSGHIPEKLFQLKDAENNFISLGITGENKSTKVFYNCYGLSGTIPEGLFLLTPLLTDITGFFNECGTINKNVQTGLTGQIPDNLLKGLTRLEKIDYLFHACNKLSSKTVEYELGGVIQTKKILVDERFFSDNLKLKSMNYTFGYFSISVGSIGEIPGNLFRNLTELSDMQGTFYSAHLANVVLDSNTFKYLNKLANISRIFSNDSANGSSTFNTSLPMDLFDQYNSNNGTGQRLVNVSEAFAKCSGLTGSPVEFWKKFSTIKEFSRCYARCINLNGYNDPINGIPANYGGGA